MEQEKEKVIKLSKKLAEDLEELLGTGDWEKSLFLRTMSKRIGNIRDEAQELAEELIESENESTAIKKIQELKEGYMKVYVSLYQADGNNLQIWQNMLKSLHKYSINRPIYAEEDHAKALVRSKPDPIRHAYVIVAIKKDSIMLPEIKQTDNLGHELLTLKEHAIEVENILAFVHANKKIYSFSDGKLNLRDIIA